ncbi:hypothetical protein C1M49_02320 [Streptococcus intermedius]|uniref:hypothetical protein n=1 Tax=Streptococcus intermedius TaxID=1338 RepID=UPI000C827F4C|nr:hypothetical protein [Streptococcus intermedius]PMR92914.1 hypothetical protein C1M49_02320 [Streptococcus intermedius]
MSFFKIYNSKEEFKEELSNYDFTSGKNLPVYIKGREMLKEKVQQADDFYNYVTLPQKVTYGYDFSSLNLFDPYKKHLAETWITEDEIRDLIDRDCTLLLFGLYEDFQFKKLNRIFLNLKNNGLKICVILGRDISSLSWQCAKQFVFLSDVEKRNSLFSCKKVNSSRRKEWLKNNPDLLIVDKSDLRKLNIQKMLLTEEWNSVFLYGHGKEDNLNLEDYTVCGRNLEVSKRSLFAPQCGYCKQNCFKNENKLIPSCDIKANTITLGSCNNAPFSDLALYDEKYNLLLNSIDSIAKTINVAITAQNSDYVELDRVVSNQFKSISTIINSSLVGSQSQISMLQIGIEPLQTVNYKIEKPSEFLVESIDRAKQYKTSGFLDENSKIYKLVNNFLVKSSTSLMRNSLYGNENLDNQWKQKINVLSEFIGEQILKDQFVDIMSFDDYESSRSYIDYDKSEEIMCECGNLSTKFDFIPYSKFDFPIQMRFCYRCGDKAVKMKGTPDICINAPEHVMKGEKIKVSTQINTDKPNDNIYVGWFVPSYIEEHLLNRQLKMKRVSGNSMFEFEIQFDDNIPAQGYYFTVFTIQNLGISLNRHFISIEGESK